jgi:RNA polymerase sigma-70 factor (ECF subfamily)
MPPILSREIIEQAIAGDQPAFRQLVESHQGFVYGLSYRFVNNSSDAEDIAQEAFIRLWKHLPKYRFDVKLSTWLYKIVSNLCLDFLKSRHAKQARAQTDVALHDHIAARGSSDQDAIDSELVEFVQRASSQLTPKQKAVFILRDLEQLEIAEIGEVLTMSPGNVKSNLYYARSKMSELINKHYQIEIPGDEVH